MGARLRISDDGWGRLHLKWWADDSTLWHAILEDFKARFPTHYDRSFAPRTKYASLPLAYPYQTLPLKATTRTCHRSRNLP